MEVFMPYKAFSLSPALKTLQSKLLNHLLENTTSECSRVKGNGFKEAYIFLFHRTVFAQHLAVRNTVFS